MPATIPTSQSPYHNKLLNFILIPDETTSPIVAIAGSFEGKFRSIPDLLALSVWAEMRTTEFSSANLADPGFSSTLAVGVNRIQRIKRAQPRR